MPSYRSLVWTTGLALFAMFFGSGNLVFPLIVGTTDSLHASWSTLGLILTAVCVPLLGCFGILLYNGKTEDFFGILGGRGFRLFSLLALALMGPFGVLARCLTVAHGTFVATGIDVAVMPFSAVSCVLLWVASLYRHKLLDLVGTWLTPLMLAALAAIFFSVPWFNSSATAPQPEHLNKVWDAFSLGATQGYQTMDLLAAFFFSGFVITQLRQKMADAGSTYSPLQIFSRAACMAGGLLAAIYAGLVYMGAHYSQLLHDVAPQSMLATIATHTMGSWGGLIVCITFALACYTTAIVLAVLFADFLRKELLQDAIPQWAALLITLAIAFGISTLEFEGIARFLGPLMESIYPFLIVLSIWNIGRIYLQKDRKLMATTSN
jgi:LIVCS family branched-chain amino acid:cation transporter